MAGRGFYKYQHLKKNNREHHTENKERRRGMLTCGLYLFRLGGNELKRMKKPSVISPLINEVTFICVCFSPLIVKMGVVTFEGVNQLFCSSDLSLAPDRKERWLLGKM